MTLIDAGDLAAPPTDIYDAGDSGLPATLLDPQARNQFVVTVGPTRLVPSLEIGATDGHGLDVTAGPSRSGVEVDETRSRTAVSVLVARPRVPATPGPSRRRDRIEVDESRQSLLVGPNRKE